MSLVPSEILNKSPGNVVKIQRTRTVQQSDIATYSPGQRAIFYLPNEIVDLRKSYFRGVMTLTPNGGGTCSFYPVQSLFSRIQVFIGSVSIFDLQSAASLYGLFKTQQEYTSLVNKTEEGFFETAQARTNSILAVEYCFRFPYDVFERVYPLNKLGNMGMRIELTVDQTSSSCEFSSGTPPSLAISNFRLQYATITPTAEVEALIDGLVSSGQYQIKMWNFESQNFSVGAVTAVNQQLAFKKRCIRGIVRCMRPSADAISGTVANKFVQDNLQAGIQSAQIRMGGQCWPLIPYDFASVAATGQPWIESLLDTRAFWEFYSSSHLRQGDTISSFNSTGVSQGDNTFSIAYDMRLDPYSLAWGNGLNTALGSQNLLLVETFSPAIAASDYFTYCMYEATVTFNKGGGILYEE